MISLTSQMHIQKFGDRKLYEYGLLEDQVPLFSRIDANIVIGLKQDKNSGKVMDDLNRLTGRLTRHGDESRRKVEDTVRYYHMNMALLSMTG